MVSFVLETRVRIEAFLFPQAVLQPVGVSRSNGAFGDGMHRESSLLPPVLYSESRWFECGYEYEYEYQSEYEYEYDERVGAPGAVLLRCLSCTVSAFDSVGPVLQALLSR